MARFKLVIEYAGTRYSGWQFQKNARTVQGDLKRVLADLSKRHDFELYGSGRTDAGVHALAQVAHLDIDSHLSPEKLRDEINERLPADIHVLSVENAPPDFHARRSAVTRSYLYQISKRRTAFGKAYVWWVREDLDVSRMRRAAELFEGMHDFRSFTEQRPEEGSTKVLVKAVEIREEDDLVIIRILGSHFLWKMVRRMVGVLVEVGRGRMTVKTVDDLLRRFSNAPAKLTAPPSGLFLERVLYRGDVLEPMSKAGTFLRLKSPRTEARKGVRVATSARTAGERSSDRSRVGAERETPRPARGGRR